MFEYGKYREALQYYNEFSNFDNDQGILFKMAICQFETNDLENALKNFESIRADGFRDPSIFYYIALIHHSRQDFSRAVSDYKDFLRKASPNHELRRKVRDAIKRCKSGIKLEFAPQYAFVENIGNEVNTYNDEYAAIQSPNFIDRYYFSSNREGSKGGKRNSEGFKDEIYGQYFADIYNASIENGNWTKINRLSSLVNSSKHDVLMDFSADGQAMVFYSGLDHQSGSILIDSFNNVQEKELFPDRMISPVVGELGDLYLTYFNDTTVIFSSKRVGGYGGSDLYITQQIGEVWTEPLNLGPEINSPYDEVSPSITNDGTTLFFSSNRLESIGGLDVFRSSFQFNTKTWGKPENLGLSVNSSMDDLYFRVSSDGRTATFSSNRKTGEGNFDIYIAYLRNQETGQLTYSPQLPFLIYQYAEEAPEFISALEESFGVEESEEPIKIREYLFSPLYYSEDDVILTPQNIPIINHIVDLLTLYPDVKVELLSHSSDEGFSDYELYFSIKRAELVAEKVIEEGISPERLLLKACGSNYPIVKNEGDGGNPLLANKYNRRIEIVVHNDEDEPIKVSYETLLLENHLKDQKSELYYNIVDGLSYKIEVAEVGQLYQQEDLSRYRDVMIEKNWNSGKYRYTVGLYKNYVDAQALKIRLNNSGFENSRIIPYVNGMRIDRSKMSDLTEEYPDLINYLRFEH